MSAGAPAREPGNGLLLERAGLTQQMERTSVSLVWWSRRCASMVVEPDHSLLGRKRGLITGGPFHDVSEVFVHDLTLDPPLEREVRADINRFDLPPRHHQRSPPACEPGLVPIPFRLDGPAHRHAMAQIEDGLEEFTTIREVGCIDVSPAAWAMDASMTSTRDRTFATRITPLPAGSRPPKDSGSRLRGTPRRNLPASRRTARPRRGRPS